MCRAFLLPIPPLVRAELLLRLVIGPATPPPHPALGREIAGERESSHQTEAQGKKGIESVEEFGDSEWASRRSGTVCVGVLFCL